MFKNASQLAVRNFIHGRCRHHPNTRRWLSQSPTVSTGRAVLGDKPRERRATADRVENEFVSAIRRQKLDDLVDSVQRSRPNPSRAWGSYVEALQYLGVEDIPLEIHQLVLRKCVPDLQDLRVAAARRMQAGNFPSKPHTYESRLADIMRNIRTAGWKPDLEDYHFVLSQYAAVGDYRGAIEALKEMERYNVKPQTKTFGLCLQTIAHRLSLPFPPQDESRLRSECSQWSAYILNKMGELGKPVTSVILDLTIRILKEGQDSDAFLAMLKAGYGIDLAYPDTYPLDRNTSIALQRLSTAALTTIVNFLGRRGLVSQMVLAFEILTSSLPRGYSSDRVNSSDDDDEEFFLPSNDPHLPAYPCATPNITTYVTVIRHCAKAKNSKLARHYLIQAVEHDRRCAAKLKEDLSRLPIKEVQRPAVSVNREAFLAMLGLANRDKYISVIRWLLSVHRQAIKSKRADLEYYSSMLASHSGGLGNELSDSVEQVAEKHESTADSPEEDIENVSPSAFFTSASQISSAFHSDHFYDHPLDVDLDAPKPSSGPVTSFDLELHLRLLQRDLKEMREMDKQVGTAYTRLCKRKKEALLRRVDRQQDIYLADQDTRVRVNQKNWVHSRVHSRAPQAAKSAPSDPDTSYEIPQVLSPG